MKKTYIKPSLEVVELMGSNEVLTTSLGVFEEEGEDFLSNKRDRENQNSGPWKSSLWGNME
ncbi:MAG: hypothetical protein ACI3YC_00680 [Alloprevotella sp.]